jgi:diacylglycerol O-acyltransferase / wax synthase
MALTTQLSREDVMFVAGETDTVYQHVGAIMVLDTTDHAGFDFEHFRQHCIERVSLIPHFRWKLHAVPMGLDRPYWVEDEHFSFDHHIRHIALPSPGDKATLCEVAAHLYCKHLDRSRPLWEIWLIEGLEGGKMAYLQKFHHCMMDGEGAFKLIETICDFEPDPAQPKTVDKEISEARAGRVPTYAESSTAAWRHFARLPGEATRNIVDILRPKILEQFVWPRKPKEERPAVPAVSFNGAISSDRAMTFAILPMDQMKVVKEHFGVSLNDIVLAVVSTAVRGYLQRHSELPSQPLRTNIPVSIKSADDDQFSNKVTNTTVTLATDLEDPVERLQAIHAESEQAKAMAHAGSKGMVEMFQMMPPILVGTLMDSLPDDQGPQMLGANLIVSNVRGSPFPMYIAGARVENMCPMSILTAGMGINITCISYAEGMDFGIMVEPDLVPHHEDLAAELELAMAQYHALCQPKTRRKPKARPKAKAKAKTKSKARAKTVAKAKKRPRPGA